MAEELARPEDNAIQQSYEADHIAHLYDDHINRMRFKGKVLGGMEMTKWAEAPKQEAWGLIKERFDDAREARFVFMLLAAAHEASER